MNLKIRRGEKRATGTAVIEIRPTLDYPRHNEKITSRTYSFRIGVPGTVRKVEISINRGPWQACRNSTGYWWYDWSGYKPGQYDVVVRAQTAEGGQTVSESRDFIVQF